MEGFRSEKRDPTTQADLPVINEGFLKTTGGRSHSEQIIFIAQDADFQVGILNRQIRSQTICFHQYVIAGKNWKPQNNQSCQQNNYEGLYKIPLGQVLILQQSFILFLITVRFKSIFFVSKENQSFPGLTSFRPFHSIRSKKDSPGILPRKRHLDDIVIAASIC
jgi:hypothetical protein